MINKKGLYQENNTFKHKIVVVTPAGRKRYLEILSRYILEDTTIDEWHLWDNCRKESDREYIEKLSKKNEKIKIIKDYRTDGTNRSVNIFYEYATNEDCFYIKLDDDIVWLPKDFGKSFYLSAIKEKDKYLWWSPTVINNAICSYLLKAKGILKTSNELSAQAACDIGWRSAHFSLNLHREFIRIIKNGQNEKLKIKENFDLNITRFSINCIGFFGETCKRTGSLFCPPDVDDEEWISATLPIILDMPGRLVGNLTVAHFSYFTQERFLLKSDLLYEYASLAGVERYEIDYKQQPKLFLHHIRNIIRCIALYLSKEVMEIEPPKRSDLKLRVDS